MSKPVDGAFLRSIQEYQSGVTLTELSEAMRKAVEAVRRVGKPATVSLDIYIEPTGGNAIGFAAEVKMKLPKEPPYKGVFFYDNENNLFRNNPTQPEMELKTVDSAAPEAPLKQVNG